MPAVRGSLRRRSRLSHPAVRGSLRRRSRLSHPAVRGTSCRRSRLSHPAVRGSSRRRSRINQPTVHRRWRHHPRLTLAYRPAADSMPAGLPLTQCPPVCLWLNARRPAADSSPPDCRWLKLAGLPLTQARRIAADSCPLVVVGRESQLNPFLFTPPSAVHRTRRSREITPPSVGKANPPSAAPSGTRGKPTRRPRFTRPAAGWGSLQPAGPCRWVVKPAGCCRYCQASRLWYPQPAAAVLTSQLAVAVFDQSVTTVFLTVSGCLAPEGSWYPWASPRKFWGGVVGLRPKRLRWGLGPRSRRRSHHGLPSSLLRHGLPSSLLRHGLPSSLLHLDLGLSVPLWRPRPVYVSVSVLWGLQSAHPPSLVVLLRHGTCLPGGGSYVRGVLCVSCVPASCFSIWFVSCPRFMSFS